MANTRRGEVEIELDGKPHLLVFDYNAIADIEESFGDQSIDTIFFGGQISRKAVIHAIRAGLSKRYRRMTARQVGNMISRTVENDPDAFGRIVRGILRGIMAGNGATPQQLEDFDRLADEAESEARENETSTGPEADESRPQLSSVAGAGES